MSQRGDIKEKEWVDMEHSRQGTHGNCLLKVAQCDRFSAVLNLDSMDGWKLMEFVGLVQQFETLPFNPAGINLIYLMLNL